MGTPVRPWPRTRARAASAIVALASARLACAAPDLGLAMSVDPPVPGTGQPVEFRVVLSNLGADPAADVVVVDPLPAGLAIPAGLAAFPGTGTYDAATGRWSVGTLNAGAAATLVIPAIVVTPTPPACLVNVATTNHSLDTHRANDRAVAAVRRSAADRCVDLSVTAANLSFSDCGGSMSLDYGVSVSNGGPDDATSVFLDLDQTPIVAPNLRLVGATCSGTRCAIEVLPVGATRAFEAVSDPFANRRDRSVTLGFAVASSDTDYATANNQASIDRALPALQSCSQFPDEGWVIVGSGCFIATAAFGSPLETHVAVLRDFRDRYLQRTSLGRAFIRFYYRHSPPVAAVIAQHAWLRGATRAALLPLIAAIEYPWRAAAVLVLALVALLARSRRQRGMAAMQRRVDS